MSNKIQSNPVYNAGLYLRLSKEDESTGQSESIVNQKEFLSSFVIEQGWNLIDIYIDDGYTGTNFKRPDFKRLIKDIENKRINLVITKDMSRLGRDYIDTGYYIERYFPEHNVRYIAVNDGIDTFENSSNNDMSPFKSVMNDLYAKDISKKIKTAFRTKREKGQYVGSFTPYGYLKDPNDKNKMIIDTETVDIVKRIFNMYVNGSGFSLIASTFNKEEIPSPGAYKMQTSNFRRPNGMSLWTGTTVKEILRNPNYTGCLAQYKFAKVSYKVKKLVKVPKESWIIVEGTHSPIIDKETFDLAQEIIDKNIGKDYSSTSSHLLAGLIYCGDCGQRLTFGKDYKGVSFTMCTNYKRFRNCKRHAIKEDELESYVLDDLRKMSKKLIKPEKIIESVKDSIKNPKEDELVKNVQAIEKRLSELKNIIRCVYEDKVKGLLTDSNFLEFTQGYNKERQQLATKLAKLQHEKERIKQNNENSNDLLTYAKNFLNFNDTNKATLIKLIDKVLLFDNKNIEIHYTFKCPV